MIVSGALAAAARIASETDGNRGEVALAQAALHVSALEPTGRGGKLEPVCGVFSTEEVKKRFEARREKYRIYADQRGPGIVVRNATGEPTVFPWEKLRKQVADLVRLVLNTLRRDEPTLPYRTIAEVVLGENQIDENVRGRIRQLKYEMNNIMSASGLEFLAARRGEESYRVTASVAYCWIRGALD